MKEKEVLLTISDSGGKNFSEPDIKVLGFCRSVVMDSVTQGDNDVSWDEQWDQ